jgi:ethanolamine utilization protein EutN
MYLGRVVGCVWATVKNRSLNGQRMLVVQPLTPELNPTGKRLVCTDWTGAGAGELVYWCRGKESSFPFLPSEVVTDTNIVGIVDSVTVNRKARTEAAPVAAPEAPGATAKRKKRGPC